MAGCLMCVCVCGTWAGAGGGGRGPTDAAGVGVGRARDAVRAGPEREPRDPEVHRVRAAGQDQFHNLCVLQPGGDAVDASLRVPGDTGEEGGLRWRGAVVLVRGWYCDWEGGFCDCEVFFGSRGQWVGDPAM